MMAVNIRKNYFVADVVVLFLMIWVMSSSLILYPRFVSPIDLKYIFVILLIINQVTLILKHKWNYFLFQRSKLIYSTLLIFSSLITYFLIDRNISLILITFTIVLMNLIEFETLANDTKKVLTISYFAMLLFMLIYIALPLINKEIVFAWVRFRGSFSNTNSFGMFMLCFYATNLLLLTKIQRENYVFKFLLIITLLISIFFLLAISSRNSFIVCVVSTLFLLYKKYEINLKLIIPAAILLLISLILISMFIVEIGIISKTVEKLKQGVILDGRLDVFLHSLKNISLFGHSKLFYDGLAFGAHNSFLHIMNLYGLSGLILYILLIRKRITDSIKNVDIVYFLIIFLLFSLNETVYISLVYIMFVAISSSNLEKGL